LSQKLNLFFINSLILKRLKIKIISTQKLVNKGDQLLGRFKRETIDPYLSREQYNLSTKNR